MKGLLNGLKTAGKFASRNISLFAVILTLVDLWAGGFVRLSRLGWPEAAVVCVLLGALAISALRRLRRAATGSEPRFREHFDLGAPLVAAAYGLVSIGGQYLFPIVYLLMAFLVSFLPRTAGLFLLAVALVFDAVATLRGGASSLSIFAMHAAFLVLFAALYHVVLRARLTLARKREREAVRNRIREVEERAKAFRLTSSTSDAPGSSQDHDSWLVASVREVDGAFGAALEVAETAMDTHTCAAFLLSPDEKYLKLYDCRSASDRVQRERFRSGEGTLGGALASGAPVRICNDLGIKGVSYYEDRAPLIGAMLAVPIVESTGRVRGVLVADRLTPIPFSERDERLLATVAREVLRSIDVERVLRNVRKSRDEKDRFFRAIDELNRAGNPEQVFSAVADTIGQLAGLDFCALTLVSEVEGKKQHRVVKLMGPAAAKSEVYVFDDNNGLVANVVRYGVPLPGRDAKWNEKLTVFDDRLPLRGIGALRIFPLVAGDRVVGTLVAGANASMLSDDTQRMLEVMAIQVAQAILRAQLFEQMERMATTDGLTGLLNHRAFQARADEVLAHAKRYERKCSIVLTDIDHFKVVNDTHGHPAGDVVLKGVAKLLTQQARDSDIVARYGGEEFAIIMPETDAIGARTTAERIRETVMRQTFKVDTGLIKVTLSLGIATFVDDGGDKKAWIDAADQALYQAKRRGRNQSLLASQIRAPAALSPISTRPVAATAS